MFTVSEVCSRYADDPTIHFEFFNLRNPRGGFHTDNIESFVCFDCPVPGDLMVLDYSLMDEDMYENSVMANCCDHADFDWYYGDKSAKVLCIALDSDECYSRISNFSDWIGA